MNLFGASVPQFKNMLSNLEHWLDRAVAAGSPNVAGLSSNPEFAGVHDDPRWIFNQAEAQ